MTRSAQRALCSTGLGLLAILTYIPTLNHEFVYDDRALIAQNSLLNSPGSIPSLFVTDLWSGVGTPHSAGGIAEDQDNRHRRYRPLLMASYAVNQALGGSRPFGYHLINVLLHAAASVLVYLVALELSWSPAGAIVAGILFVIHPLHTEAVAWAAGRPEMMMSLGLVGALWYHLRGRPGAAVAAFLFGLFSKEQAVVFPALALLTDLCRNPRAGSGQAAGRPLLHRHAGYALVLGLFLFLRSVVLGGFQPDRYPFSENPLEHLAGVAWALSVVKMAGHYLWLALWPAVLSVDYSYDALPMATTAFDAGVLWSVIAWSSLLGAGVRGWRWDRRITVAVGWTALTFLPAANLLVPVGTPLAERLFYLPLGGLCLLAGLLAGWLLPETEARGRQRHLVLASGLTLALALTLRTEARLQDWTDSEALFRSAVAAFPTSARAHFLLGSELLGKGTPSTLAEGIKELETALMIYPDYVRGDAVFANNLGVGLIQVGRYDEGRAALQHALALDGGYASAHVTRGWALQGLGRLTEARAAYEQVLAMPDAPGIAQAEAARKLMEVRPIERR
jgi:hypothetical protein